MTAVASPYLHTPANEYSKRIVFQRYQSKASGNALLLARCIVGLIRLVK